MGFRMIHADRTVKVNPYDPRNSIRYNQSNLRTRELLHRQYGRNPEVQVYLDHAVGLVHNLATYNAKVCTSATLRLYRSTRARRGLPAGTRSLDRSTRNLIGKGHYGTKLAMMSESGEEMVEVKSHPVLDLLNNPNPLYPGTLLEHLKWYVSWIGGNGYEYMSKMNGLPFMLSPLFPQWVSIEATVEEGLTSYLYGRGDTGPTPYLPEEVLHYKLYPSPYSALYGIGALFGVLPHADLIQDCLIHDISMAKNGMHPDGIWMLPEGTSGETERKFLRQIQSKFRGVKNWYKHLVMTGKVEFVSPMIPEKDLMNLPKQQETKKEIRMAFGHTESMADSTTTNVASAIQSHDKQFLGGTIWPALLNDASTKNTMLLPAFGLDPDEYCFAYDNPVERDESAYADRLRLDFQTGLRTANEVRIELGLEEADDEYADALLINGQPLGPVAAPDPFGGMLGGGGSGAAEGPESDLLDEVTEPPALPAGEPEEPEEPALLGYEPEDTGGATLSGDFKAAMLECEAPQWRDDCPFCQPTTKAGDSPIDDPEEPDPNLEDTFRRMIAEAQEDFIRSMITSGTLDSLAMRDRWAAELQEAMVPIFKLAADEQTAGLVGSVDASFDITDQRALEFLRGYTVELADDLLGTTADMVKRAVEVGLERGLGEDDVVKLMDGIPETRARMIARTEKQRAVQNGKRQAMIRLGVKKVRWATSPGATLAHMEIASRSPKPIDEPFVKAGETVGPPGASETMKRDIYCPPARPNCRCILVAVLEED